LSDICQNCKSTNVRYEGFNNKFICNVCGRIDLNED